MNKIYKLKFDKRHNELVVVSEIASGMGKQKNTGHIADLCTFSRIKKLTFGLTLLSGLMLGALPAMANPASLPTGGKVVGGAGSISANNQQMTIHQQTPNMAVNWHSFDIGKNNTVQFIQPSGSAVALNRVTGASGSQIMGTLKANGQVFIVNPNGILFGKDARVNVAGLVASTKNIAVKDFMNGQYQLSGSGKAGAQVINQGNLTTTKGGYIVLAGNQVNNSGSISTPGGKAVLAAGQTVTLQLDNGGLTSVSVDGSVVNALIENHGLISATNGQVYLTAQGRNMLLNTVVNNSGTIEAQGLESRGGEIVLNGGASGVVSQSGQLLAGSQSGKGGKITLEGQNIHLAAGSRTAASGKTGGGEVYAGGGWQGKDNAIKNAKKVVMDKAATIDVSAKDTGNGGTAVLWSDDYTNFQGAILAKGGAQSGNGGRVETSSYHNLQAFGDVNTAAPKGQGGDWLLDPLDLAIVTGAVNVQVDEPDKGVLGADETATDYIFAPKASNSQLSSAKIEEQLNNNTNVTVTTHQEGAAQGNITLSTDVCISKSSGGGDATLTLIADNNIQFGAMLNSNEATNVTISSTSGKLNLNLLAGGTTNDGTATVLLNKKTTIDLHGGDFTVGSAWKGDGAGKINFVAPHADGSTIKAGNISITALGTAPVEDLKSSTVAGMDTAGLNLDASGNITIKASQLRSQSIYTQNVNWQAAGALDITSAGDVNLLANDADHGGGKTTLSAANDINITSSDTGAINLDGSGAGDSSVSLNSTNGNISLNSAAKLNIKNTTFAAKNGQLNLAAKNDIDVRAKAGNTLSFGGATQVKKADDAVNITSSEGNISLTNDTDSYYALDISNAKLTAASGNITLTGHSTANPAPESTLGFNLAGVSLTSVNIAANNINIDGTSDAQAAGTGGIGDGHAARGLMLNGGVKISATGNLTMAGSTQGGLATSNSVGAHAAGIYLTGANSLSAGAENSGTITGTARGSNGILFYNYNADGKDKDAIITQLNLAGKLAINGTSTANDKVKKEQEDLNTSQINSFGISFIGKPAGTVINVSKGSDVTITGKGNESGWQNITGSSDSYNKDPLLTVNNAGKLKLTGEGEHYGFNVISQGNDRPIKINALAGSQTTVSGSGTGANGTGINHAITVTGATSDVPVTISGEGTLTGINLAQASTVDGATVSGTSATGTGIIIGEGVSAKNATINGNTTTGTGVNVTSGATVTLGDAGTLTGNATDGTTGTGVTLDGATISGGTVSGTGATVGINISKASTLNNKATLSGTSTAGSGVNIATELTAADGTVIGKSTSGTGINIAATLTAAKVDGTSDSNAGVYIGSTLTASSISGTSKSGTGISFVSPANVAATNGTIIGTTVNGTGVNLADGTTLDLGTTGTLTGKATDKTANPKGTGVILGQATITAAAPASGTDTGATISGKGAEGGVSISKAINLDNLTIKGTGTTGAGVNISAAIASANKASFIGTSTSGAGVSIGAGATVTAAGGTVSGTSTSGNGVDIGAALTAASIIGVSTSATAVNIGAATTANISGTSTSGTGINVGAQVTATNGKVEGISTNGTGVIVAAKLDLGATGTLIGTASTTADKGTGVIINNGADLTTVSSIKGEGATAGVDIQADTTLADGATISGKSNTGTGVNIAKALTANNGTINGHATTGTAVKLAAKLTLAANGKVTGTASDASQGTGVELAAGASIAGGSADGSITGKGGAIGVNINAATLDGQKIKGTSGAGDGVIIAASLSATSSTITGNTKTGTGVKLQAASLTLDSASTLTGTATDSGTGVAVNGSGSTFALSGGTVNAESDSGTGLAIHVDGTATDVTINAKSISGDAISGEKALTASGGTAVTATGNAPDAASRVKGVEVTVNEVSPGDQTKQVTAKVESLKEAIKQKLEPLTALKGQVDELQGQLNNAGDSVAASDLTSLKSELATLSQRVSANLKTLNDINTALTAETVKTDKGTVDGLTSLPTQSDLQTISDNFSAAKKLQGDTTTLKQNLNDKIAEIQGLKQGVTDLDNAYNAAKDKLSDTQQTDLESKINALKAQVDPVDLTGLQDLQSQLTAATGTVAARQTTVDDLSGQYTNKTKDLALPTLNDIQQLTTSITTSSGKSLPPAGAGSDSKTNTPSSTPVTHEPAPGAGADSDSKTNTPSSTPVTHEPAPDAGTEHQGGAGSDVTPVVSVTPVTPVAGVDVPETPAENGNSTPENVASILKKQLAPKLVTLSSVNAQTTAQSRGALDNSFHAGGEPSLPDSYSHYQVKVKDTDVNICAGDECRLLKLDVQKPAGQH